MSENTCHRKDLAKQQFKTAVWLFLKGKDLSSVITLASAASNILSQIVRNAGKETFVDYACRVHDALYGITPKRLSYKHLIDNMLGVNVHKHMSPSCPKTCTLDLYNCAINMLIMAMGDYVTLYGKKDGFIKAFLKWTWEHQDATEIIKQYNNMPAKLKKTGKKYRKIDLGNAKKKVANKAKKTEKKRYRRFKLAEKQLESAIMLFLTNSDRQSAITLAGAADVIFCELVNREGKSNFTDDLSEKHKGKWSREEIGRAINNTLNINTLKHFDKGDGEFINIDIDECAIATILKSLANYNKMGGKNKVLVNGFIEWVRENLSGKYGFNK
jgi:hypothetical protein